MKYYSNIYIYKGFLIGKLLSAYGDQNQIHKEMMECAWTAQWVPFSKSIFIIKPNLNFNLIITAQESYVKRAFKTAIVCNSHLIGILQIYK
jgi:hypothetical protein